MVVVLLVYFGGGKGRCVSGGGASGGGDCVGRVVGIRNGDSGIGFNGDFLVMAGVMNLVTWWWWEDCRYS